MSRVYPPPVCRSKYTEYYYDQLSNRHCCILVIVLVLQVKRAEDVCDAIYFLCILNGGVGGGHTRDICGLLLHFGHREG